MPATPLKEHHFVVAWLLSIVLSSIGGMLAGGVIGALFGAICHVLGTASAVLPTVQVLGAVTGLAMSYVALRWSMNRVLVRKVTASSQPASENAV
jgi:hypothetical protein